MDSPWRQLLDRRFAALSEGRTPFKDRTHRMPFRDGRKLSRHFPRTVTRTIIFERVGKAALLPRAMNRFCDPILVELALGHFHRRRGLQALDANEASPAPATSVDLFAITLGPEVEKLVLRYKAEVIFPVLLRLLGGVVETRTRIFSGS
jgi:hypothetical protein